MARLRVVTRRRDRLLRVESAWGTVGRRGIGWLVPLTAVAICGVCCAGVLAWLDMASRGAVETCFVRIRALRRCSGRNVELHGVG